MQNLENYECMRCLSKSILPLGLICETMQSTEIMPITKKIKCGWGNNEIGLIFVMNKSFQAVFGIED